jgi:molybdenum-dependent DNA-binding transcriptional regulator ModE|tara:strand:- start:101 stop:352 length:252 start_codon:yes stop_codon:yes gene_type:complete
MILEIILGLLVITLGWTTFNLTRKVERLETWIESYAQRVIDTQDTLKEIDDKGSFEADDEIGVVFQSIKETIDELNEITQEEL